MNGLVSIAKWEGWYPNRGFLIQKVNSKEESISIPTQTKALRCCDMMDGKKHTCFEDLGGSGDARKGETKSSDADVERPRTGNPSQLKRVVTSHTYKVARIGR